MRVQDDTKDTWKHVSKQKSLCFKNKYKNFGELLRQKWKTFPLGFSTLVGLLNFEP